MPQQQANQTPETSHNTITMVQKTPGPLRGETWITIQTRQAARLVVGRKATDSTPSIIGLTRFGSLTSMLFFCARLDDPYADWWLVKVEDALQHAAVGNGQLRQRIENLLAAKPGMHVDIAESLSPIQVPLKFGNPYAYQGAVLLTEFDALVRSILTARHVGFLDRDEAERTLLFGGRAVRRVFATATGFHNQSVKRKDIHENNARARTAQELMGQIPEDILTSARRARHAPEPISTDPQEGLASDTTLFATG